MLVERPRAPRHLFTAHLELLDVESESRIVTRTRDLRYLDSGLRLKIAHGLWVQECV
jgi:hypothetical protein